MAYQYCVIKSKLTGLALDVNAADVNPGAHVIPWEQHAGDNQIWYEDPSTGTIRSKLNNFCIDIEGDRLVLNPFKPGDGNQQWECHEQQIRNRYQHNIVLDVYENNEAPGAKIGPYEFSGGKNQSWDFEYIGGHAPHSRQEFYIESELNDKVVDIETASPDEGTKIIMWSKSNEQLKNQLWYFDSNGFIRSSLNDMVFANSDSGKKLKMTVFSDDPRGHWKQDGKKIVNGNGECLDIIAERKDDGAKLCSYRYKDRQNQNWRLAYV